jgi:hypothetical protein
VAPRAGAARAGDGAYCSPIIRRQLPLQGRALGRYDNHFCSNELATSQLFPHVRELRGSLFGVGAEQILDLMASNFTPGQTHRAAYIVDCTESNSLFTRTLFELALYHRSTFHTWPTVEQLTEYLAGPDYSHIDTILGCSVTPQQLELIHGVLREGIHPYGDASLRYPVSAYFRLKCSLRTRTGEPISWLARRETREGIFDAYAQNRIVVLSGDLSDRSFMSKVAAHARKNGHQFDIINLTNVTEGPKYYPEAWDNRHALFANLEALPKSRKAVVLQTLPDPDHLPAAPQPAAVKRDPVFSGFFGLDFHYNGQPFSRWAQTVRDSDGDFTVCWRELEQAFREGRLDGSGISWLGPSARQGHPPLTPAE